MTPVIKRELAASFTAPLAYIFLIAFLVLSGVATFFIGRFFVVGEATLFSFFQFHPWLYLFFIPALTMRLWAEERQNGTIELLATLPVKTGSLVWGKFCSVWVFAAVALLLTIPLWLTVNYLGQPDNNVILISYLGSLLMAGGFVAIGCYASSITHNQVVAFILAALISLLFIFSGTPVVQGAFAGWAPDIIIEILDSISIVSHFENFQRGIIALTDLLYFGVLIGFFLYATNLNVPHLRRTGVPA